MNLLQKNQFSASGYRMFGQDRNCFCSWLENMFKQLNLHSDKKNRSYISQNKYAIKKMVHFRLMQALNPKQYAINNATCNL